MHHTVRPFIHATELGSKSRFKQLIDVRRIHTPQPSLWRALLAWL